MMGLSLRLAREANGLTAEDLEDLTGFPRTRISAWENGRALPDAYSTHVLSRVLGVPSDFLLSISNSYFETLQAMRDAIKLYRLGQISFDAAAAQLAPHGVSSEELRWRVGEADYPSNGELPSIGRSENLRRPAVFELRHRSWSVVQQLAREGDRLEDPMGRKRGIALDAPPAHARQRRGNRLLVDLLRALRRTIHPGARRREAAAQENLRHARRPIESSSARG